MTTLKTASATMPIPTSWSTLSPPPELDVSVTGGAVVVELVVVEDAVTVPVVVVVLTPSALAASAPDGNARVVAATSIAPAARTHSLGDLIAPNISADGP
jgi:hypothetical protein